RALQGGPGDRGSDPRRPVGDLRGRRARAARARSRQGESPDPRLRSRASGRVGDHRAHDRAADSEAAGANAAPSRPLPVEPDRPRPHPARPRHPPGAAPGGRGGRPPGERLHPATRLLLNESAHFERWTSDHELHAFNALWDMDEIMAANFMVFADVVEAEDYDLWIGDEGWDLDYYLHENPGLKRAPYVFITDFIGVLPMRDDRSSTEFRRAWEKNAENIDHLRLHPDVRDLSIMVGDEADVLDREFGPELPNMRQWAREHFQFSGYTYHFDPTAYRDRQVLRHRLGYRDGERTILVSVGGTRAGRHLLARFAEAFPGVAPQLPDTRLVLVAGPRLDPRELATHPRIEVRPFVPDLYEHHAAVDLAIVQGGLTTTMELAAFQTPFLYFPLRNHFEQQHFVARRLERLGAGVRMDFDRTSAEALGAAMVANLGKPVRYADVPVDGTERAARMIANLL